MRLVLFFFCLLAHCVENLPNWSAEVRARNAEMKVRVDAWLAGVPKTEQPLYVVYLFCSNQKPFPNHRERLNRVLTEIQTWYRDQHEAAGFGAVTFALERENDGAVKLHVAQLPFTVKSRYGANKRETHRACVAASRRLLKAVGVDYDHSFVLVLTTIPDDRGAAPFFGNIIQDRGYCFAVDAPWLDSVYSKVDGPKVWKGRTVGPANSALIGGIAHELGHGFGLKHCDEHASQRVFGESLMGRGNYTWRQEIRGEGKGSFLLDTDACLLISRAPFAGATRDLHRIPKASVDYLRLEQGADRRIAMTGTVRSDIPVYAVRVFDDPPGNQEYDALSGVALPDAESGAFRIGFTPLPIRGEHELRVVLYHVNGRWTSLESKMPVAANRRAELEPVRRKLYRLPSPRAVSGETCALTWAKAESARVGWGSVMRGQTPGGSLRTGGKGYTEGLFVHSPSRVVYRLGGEWETLSVTAGLQDETAKRATFRILGDGRELVSAPNLSTAKQLSVDVADVDVLELITAPPAEGNRSSWTIWAEPTLTR